jgi:hypothetical protein
MSAVTCAVRKVFVSLKRLLDRKGGTMFERQQADIVSGYAMLQLTMDIVVALNFLLASRCLHEGKCCLGEDLHNSNAMVAGADNHFSAWCPGGILRNACPAHVNNCDSGCILIS